MHGAQFWDLGKRWELASAGLSHKVVSEAGVTASMGGSVSLGRSDAYMLQWGLAVFLGHLEWDQEGWGFHTMYRDGEEFGRPGSPW